MGTYNTSEFRKGLKVQIDGDPYLMLECNFVKPGKGNAFYKCKLRNLIRNTVLDRTYKGETRWNQPMSRRSKFSSSTVNKIPSFLCTMRPTSSMS